MKLHRRNKKTPITWSISIVVYYFIQIIRYDICLPDLMCKCSLDIVVLVM
jgi:hypothetical protein